MSSTPDNRLIVDPTPLDEAHTPGHLVSRQKALQRLTSSFRAAKSPPLPRWLITGPPGSGKTILGRVVLQQIAQTGALTAEVNCWQAKSPFSVMDALVRDLRILGAEAHDTNAKRERLERLLRDKRLVILLDEIDRPPPSARNAILYAVATLPNVGLIATSQDRTLLLTLEPRVRSRFQPTEVRLSPYTRPDLHSILTDRADSALKRGACSADIVDTLVSGSGGDARAAIGLLAVAAGLAEADRSTRIETKHAQAAVSQGAGSDPTGLPAWLTTHHAIIHELVGDEGPMGTTDLYARYVAVAEKRGMMPAARRTFTDYLSSLIHAGKLAVDEALTTGNHRVVRIEEPAPSAQPSKPTRDQAASPSDSDAT